MQIKSSNAHLVVSLGLKRHSGSHVGVYTYIIYKNLFHDLVFQDVDHYYIYIYDMTDFSNNDFSEFTLTRNLLLDCM